MLCFGHQRLQGLLGEVDCAAAVLEPLDNRVHGALVDLRHILRGRCEERHVLRHESARRPLGNDVRRPRGHGQHFLDILAGRLLPEEQGQLLHAVGVLVPRTHNVQLPPAALHHRTQERRQLFRRVIVELAGSGADLLLELLRQGCRRRLRRRTPREDPDQVVGAHLAQELGILGASERLQGSAREAGQPPQTSGRLVNGVLELPPERVAQSPRELLGLLHGTTVPRYGADLQGCLVE